MNTTKVFVIANSKQELKDLINDIESFFMEYNIAEDTRHVCNIVIDEIVTNIISYAYNDHDQHKITVTLTLQNEEISGAIEDDGQPFDPLNFPMPDIEQPIEDRSVGGLGIHIVRRVMDRIEYQRQGNRNKISFVKKIIET